MITFTTFGYCLSNDAEVPCSIAVSRLFDEGWKGWSESRDVEMRGILEILGWLNVLCWTCEGSLHLDNGVVLIYPIVITCLVLACFALFEWRRKCTDKSVGGDPSLAERYRRIAITMMALSTLSLAITTVRPLPPESRQIMRG